MEPDSKILLEQYKLFVEMADRISARRGQANKFYVFLLSGLMAILSVISGYIDQANNYQYFVFTLTSIIGLIFCVLWIVNIHAYKQLNSGKFKVIHEMEANLPFKCYDREWELLGRGKDKKKYLKLTNIEIFIPYAVMIPYLALSAYTINMIIKDL